MRLTVIEELLCTVLVPSERLIRLITRLLMIWMLSMFPQMIQILTWGIELITVAIIPPVSKGKRNLETLECRAEAPQSLL